MLSPGLEWLEERTGVPVAGVVPYYHDIQIPEEDSVSLERRQSMKATRDYLIDIAVIGLPHISNFDDFDPLGREPGVRLRYVEAGDELGTPDMVVLPGTKTTMSDLEWLRRQGIAEGIRSLRRGGTVVLGICGGFQMMGKRILDPHRVESGREATEGLGLLPVTTIFATTKETHRVVGEVMANSGVLRGARGLPVEGYEIHMGRSLVHGRRTATADGVTPGTGTEMRPERPFYIRERSGRRWGRPDGAMDSGGLVPGTYIHGLLHNSGLRLAILRSLAQRKGVVLPQGGDEYDRESRQGEYDRLADLVRASLDMALVYRVTGLDGPPR